MTKSLFNNDWQFSEFELNTPFDKMFNSSLLKTTNLPHDYMIWHVKDLYKSEIGFYKKSFDMSVEPGHTYILRFEGVYMDSEIYLNGTKIFEWKYGYSTFDVDLTSYIKEGTNIVCVVTTYRNLNSRWYSGAGIYRNVWLYDFDETYIPLDGVYLNAVKEIDGFVLNVETEAVSLCGGAYTIENTLLDASEAECASVSSSVSLSDTASVCVQSMSVEAPVLWDITNPYLYKVRTRILKDDVVKEEVFNNFGFRTIEFDCDKGFFLNERNVKIQGVCQHHDLGALGAAMNKSALRRQFEKLIKMGVNSIRTSHNMPAVEVMELADEMGILIYSESFDMWELPKTEFDYGNYFPTWWDKDVTSWVRRDRNHPSLIIWGIGNEIYDTHLESGLKWTRLLRDKVRELDHKHNAFIGIGSNYIAWENAQKCSDELELSGYNYGERLYDEHHKKYPHWRIFGSETGSTVQSRGIYHFPLETSLLTHMDAQCSCLGNCTTNWGSKSVDQVVADHRDRDYVFGQYIWTGWDYIGEPTPYHSKNSFFGQIDTAGFEKDTYYHYQAEWTDYKKAPMAHLLPYWDFNEGQIIDVIGYSNAPVVELFFNGKSLGQKKIDHLHGKKLYAQWKVPYSAGELKLAAYDECGAVVAEDVKRSFGDPAKIKLACTVKEIPADGETLAFVDISTVDAFGTLVADARNRVSVSVSGPGRLVGLDNGDSTDYEEYKGTSRRLFSGKLLAIIAPTFEPGEIKVTVESVGLPSESIIISSAVAESHAPCMYCEVNFASPSSDDVPVRKIELTRQGGDSLTKENPTATVSYKIYPENATYRDIEFVALTPNSVTADYVNVEVIDDVAHITAVGDGEFTLMAYCCNDKNHAEVISTLDYKITGLGQAKKDAYSMIPGINFDKAHSEDVSLSFLGGAFLPAGSDNISYVTYSKVDLGSVGSADVHVPIFSFRDSLNLDIIDGDYETGECVFKGEYAAKSIYNTYQENVFTLSKTLTGVHTLTFVFHTDDRISFEGFYFTKNLKAYSVIPAVSFSNIAGDTYVVGTDAITSIGNNVAIEYDDMDFAEGLSKIIIRGRSHNEKTSIHILYVEDEVVRRDLAEIPYTEDYETFEIELPDIRTKGKINLVFLPGSNFDLKEFRFVAK
ncbi:beta-galactosidase [Lachnospiraceae bacterium YSD2013]|nr:beta-galactosidase [Lachnospiraceae bacterium YSD2013]